MSDATITAKQLIGKGRVGRVIDPTKHE